MNQLRLMQKWHTECDKTETYNQLHKRHDRTNLCNAQGKKASQGTD